MAPLKIRRIIFGLCALVLLALPITLVAQLKDTTAVIQPCDQTYLTAALTDPSCTTDPYYQEPLLYPIESTSQPSTFIVSFERVGPPVYDANGVQIGGAFINPCTAELVDVTGSTTITIAQSVDPDGSTSVRVSASTKGSGFGQTSFQQYTFSENQQFIVKAAFVNQEFTSSFTDKFMLKGARSLDNWMIRAIFRLKISATGAILVDLHSLTGDLCRG